MATRLTSLRLASPLGVTLLLAVAAPGAEAQTDRDLELRDLFDRASRGTLIRIQLADGSELLGPLADRGDDRVWLNQTPSIPFERIGRVWIRGRATRRGAVIGVVTLGIAGGVILGAVCSDRRDETGCSVPIQISVGALAGAATGFALGTAIGVAFPQWHLRFP